MIPESRRGVVLISAGWGATLVGAFFGGVGVAVAVMAALAGLAAWQGATVWEGNDDGGRARAGDDGLVPLVCAASAAAMPLLAGFGDIPGAVAVILGSAGVFGFHHLTRGGREVAGQAVGVAVPVGVAAASVVLLFRGDAFLAAYVVGSASVFDMGSYLVGVGSRSRFEGPVAGAIGAMCASFTFGAFEPGPFERMDAWILGVVMAALYPVGVALVEGSLPPGSTGAWAQRRLDSLVVVAPLVLLVSRFVM